MQTTKLDTSTGDKARDEVLSIINVHKKGTRTEDDLKNNNKKMLGGLSDLKVMEGMVEKLKKMNEQIIIECEGKSHTFQYLYNDAIFALSEPFEEFSGDQNPFCNCCKESFAKLKQKDIKYCQFCALAYCPKCRYKQRTFPFSKDEEKGDICKVCDRKFFIRDLLQEKHLQIEA